MSSFTLLGQENLSENPSLLVPNRLYPQGLMALSRLLKKRLTVVIDSSFPLSEEMQKALRDSRLPVDDFNFSTATPRNLRATLSRRLRAGMFVLFIPGKVAKTKGALADVPSPYLMHLGSLHLSPNPLFSACYSEDLSAVYQDVQTKGSQEILSILPHLSPGPQAGERMLAAWLQCSAELFAQRKAFDGSLTSALVVSMRANSSLEITDGMTHTSLSYAKVLGVAMAVARYLSTRADLRIGVILPPGPGAVIATIACLLAGKIPVMINYASSKASFASAVRQAKLSSFITAQKLIDKLPQFSWPAEQQLILIEDLLRSLDKKSLVANILLAKVAPAWLICRLFKTDERRGDDEAILLFTSGSSGTPKGVPLTHRMLLGNVAQCASRLSLNNDIFLGSLPIFHSFGLTVTMLLPLITGYPICTYPNPTDAKTLCDLVERYKLTLLCATPTFARAMMRRCTAKSFKSVNYFVVGAEKLSIDLQREFESRCGVRLFEGYGLTEATPVCAVSLPNAPLLPDSPYYIPGERSGSIGAPLPGLAVKITSLDDDNLDIPLTQQGMIWIKGVNVFSGYFGHPEMNKNIFKDGWFKTGDIGCMDLNGFIILNGRLSRFAKIGGEMVPHEEVERILFEILNLDAFAQELPLAITSIDDKQKGEALVILSTLAEHETDERAALSEIRLNIVRRGLPSLWCPKYIVPVEKVPMLPTGKLDLHSCKLLAQEALRVNS